MFATCSPYVSINHQIFSKLIESSNFTDCKLGMNPCTIPVPSEDIQGDGRWLSQVSCDNTSNYKSIIFIFN